MLARAVAGRAALTAATLARVKIDNGDASFTVDPYDVVDPDNGNDTARQVGLHIEIEYATPKSYRSDKIGFIQTMKATKGGVSYLFENEKNRATGADSTEEGWVVDRASGKKSGVYGQNDDGSAGGNTRFGNRTSDTVATNAWLYDQVGLNRAVGQTIKVDAVTYAFDFTHGKYLGGVSWGFTTDAGGTTTAKAPALHGTGNPAGAQREALLAWNKQARLDDVAKRNAPGQTTLVVPWAPVTAVKPLKL